VESEIAIAARRHKSVSHGIAVLETAYHLAAAGYAVETEPGAVLAAADEPWHARAEPDLALTLSGELWPVEVQREVSKRLVAKWIKSLELNGRLALSDKIDKVVTNRILGIPIFLALMWAVFKVTTDVAAPLIWIGWLIS
jgi:Fe2+ transport system protein B